MIETKTVVFVDVLGFARQVLQNENDLDHLDPFYNSSHSYEGLLKLFKERPAAPRIERLFALFHVGLEEEIAESLKASHLHSVVFSDSAFVAFEYPIDALVFCQQLMRKMIRGAVPVRMGVAHGSFKALRFKTDLGRDITVHSSYFLGSGVVKAHKAESSGISGLRILLHRDFPVPPGFDDDEILSLTPPASDDATARTRFAKGSVSVDRELAYLLRHMPEGALPDDHYVNEGIDAQNRGLIASVEQMRDASEKAFHFHYEDSLRAIQKMPVDPPLPTRLDIARTRPDN